MRASGLTISTKTEERKPNTQRSNDFCVVYSDDEVERDEDGYFIKPDRLAGTHPRQYTCGGDELIIRMPAETRDR